MNLEKMIIIQSLFVYDKLEVKYRNDHFLPPNRWSERLIREEKQTVRHLQYSIFLNQGSYINFNLVRLQLFISKYKRREHEDMYLLIIAIYEEPSTRKIKTNLSFSFGTP